MSYSFFLMSMVHVFFKRSSEFEYMNAHKIIFYIAQCNLSNTQISGEHISVNQNAQWFMLRIKPGMAQLLYFQNVYKHTTYVSKICLKKKNNNKHL